MRGVLVAVVCGAVTVVVSGDRPREPDAPGPAREAVWRELLAADIDHINTDDLAGLEDFLLKY